MNYLPYRCYYQISFELLAIVLLVHQFPIQITIRFFNDLYLHLVVVWMICDRLVDLDYLCLELHRKYFPFFL
jgi:hypothetical protein